MLHLCHEHKYTKEFKVCVNIHSHSYIFLIILDFTDSLGFVFYIEGTKQCQFEQLIFEKFQYCLHKINPASLWVNTFINTVIIQYYKNFGLWLKKGRVFLDVLEFCPYKVLR